MKSVGPALLLLLGCPVALAVLPNPVVDGMRKCSAEVDQARRLACFDALSASLPKVEQDQFGLTTDVVRKREPVAVEKAPEVLTGKITAVHQGAGGMLVFTLDNKQVWSQSQADNRFIFKVGEAVQIEHGAMGSLWLAADKGRKTRVKRVI